MKINPPASLNIAASLGGDKSLSHRALIFAALTPEICRLENLSKGADVASTLACLARLGLEFEVSDAWVIVHGEISPSKASLDCGNSGTTTRLLMGLLAGIEGMEIEFGGDESLSARPMARVVDPLRAMGANITYLGEEGRLPIALKGTTLKGADHELAIASAQVKSAILLAGLHAEGETKVSEPFTSRDHTEIILATLGDRPWQGFETKIPGDISSAAFLIAAALLHDSAQATIERTLLNPTRTGFLYAARRMGASLEFSGQGYANGEPFSTIKARSSDLQGITLSASEVPAAIDEVPLLALMATQAEGESRLEGLAELRVKESDRLAETLRILQAFGANAAIDGDDLVIQGPTELQGTKIDAGDDHRMVMLATIAALIAQGESEVLGQDAVAISYPSFFADLGINL